ncbi:ASCH domain-containing protein [Arcanobacterium canis]|uniref:ASCH domain-containing protein n=1 Tax=Arcanobacterium canis TaxID=999183 RepID=A0ABY8FYK3_9ACTO|nr:ASCH domain-containing protein [Arcanobacterium canis]WFM83587.1 ASCH domain-containing protein [Arcanobacterium canis]
MSQIIEPTEENLDAFWTNAVTHLRFEPVAGVTGQDDIAALRPPAFAFGSTAEQANEAAILVLSGKKRATVSYKPEYEAEEVPLPRAGEFTIMVDGAGIPRALLSNERVDVLPFREVGQDIAQAEGQSDLAQWQEIHRDFFTAVAAMLGHDFSESDEIVAEIFTVAYRAE